MGFGVCKNNPKQKRMATGPQAESLPTSSRLLVEPVVATTWAVVGVLAATENLQVNLWRLELRLL
jgi:hypothetical protein